MTKNLPDIIIADDLVPFPDMLPVDNDVLESIIAAELLGATLMPMPYRDDDLYHMFTDGQVPSPNMIHTYDGMINNRMIELKTAQDIWPARQYAGKANAKPRVTKRQKTLKARALNKANRKRARHG